MALKSVSEELLPVWDKWSQQSSKYKPGECNSKWQSFRGGVTVGTLYYFARLDLAETIIQPSSPLLSPNQFIGQVSNPRSANARIRMDLIKYKTMTTTTRALGESFCWDELKVRFEAVFGKVDERRFSLEQLLEYANRKFGKSLEQLLEINDKSWERRREWKAKAAYQSLSDMAADTEF